MRYQLPETDNELVAHARADYETALNDGSREEVQDAQHRLAWAMVHAKDKTKIQLGIDLAEQLLQIEGGEQREPEYYIAVGLYRLHHCLAARSRINSIIERWPNFRQAVELKSLIDETVVWDGLMGIGVGLGVAAVAGFGALAAAMLSKR